MRDHAKSPEPSARKRKFPPNTEATTAEAPPARRPMPSGYWRAYEMAPVQMKKAREVAMPAGYWQRYGIESTTAAAQQKVGGAGAGAEQVQEAARVGVAGSSQPLPFLDRIQSAFGRHDVSGVRAHLGDDAAGAAQAMGARAFATGNDVAFADMPDLHTAAHEAAHVVQQRGGVQLAGGMGAAGDRYEQHADAVADAVVAGRSAESLLDQHAPAGFGGGGSAAGPVQRLLADQGGTLYVPKAWMDTQFDDRTETVRDATAGESYQNPLKRELLENINSVLSPPTDISTVEEMADGPATVKKLKEDGVLLIDTNAFTQLGNPGGAAAATTVKQQFGIALDNIYNVYFTPADKDANKIAPGLDPVATYQKKLIVSPRVLVKAENDLVDNYNIEHICALIAVFKAEGENAVKQKLGLRQAPTDTAGWYKALHDHYWITRGIQYDEPSTHPAIFAEWGYKMVFSGNCTFAELPTVIQVKLDRNKEYIFDITGHAVLVKMKKALQPGPNAIPNSEVASYFEFKSDKSNFNKLEIERKVENIYAK